MSRVLYIQYTNPAGYPPLEHSSRILADRGWSVLFLGTGALGADTLEFPPHRNIAVRRMVFCHPGWRQKLHFIRYCLWVLWVAITWRPDWVYASDNLVCPAAWLLSWLPGLKLAYHEHDAPDDAAGESGFLRLVRAARRAVAQRARVCVLPNGKRLEQFREETGPIRKGVCVWNCPTVDEVVPEPKGAVAESIWVLYHGSIVPARLPMSVVDALAVLPDTVKLRVVGYQTVGRVSYVDELKSRAKAIGVGHRIEFTGAIPQRGDLLRVAATCDIGLALMPLSATDQNLKTMTGASNKAFDYLACGLGLVVSDLDDWREMFVAPGYGVCCDPGNPENIAAAIRHLVEAGRMRAMGESGRQRILSDWNYAKAFEPVLQQMCGAQAAGMSAVANETVCRRI